MSQRIMTLCAICSLVACGADSSPDSAVTPDHSIGLEFRIAGKLESKKLNEASGIQAGPEGVFFLHNDEGKTLYAIDQTGRNLGSMKLDGSKNKDWEDISRIPGEAGPMILVADVGDNHAGRKDVELYFVAEPSREKLNDDLEVAHRLFVSYPGGPRDVESVAFDPSSDMILLLSKRDRPPRLYGVTLEQALAEDRVEAQFLAEVPGFRPPSRKDILRSPKRGLWVSQPTGMDISTDGRLAAVITYRSLYVFQRGEDESWAEAFQRQPMEFVGPPGEHDEAVAFSHDGKSIYVTTERRPAPLYRLDLPEELLE